MGEGRVRSAFLGSLLTGWNVGIECKESKHGNRRTGLEGFAAIEEGNDVGLNHCKGNSDVENDKFERYEAVVPTDIGDPSQVGPEML